MKAIKQPKFLKTQLKKYQKQGILFFGAFMSERLGQLVSTSFARHWSLYLPSSGLSFPSALSTSPSSPALLARLLPFFAYRNLALHFFSPKRWLIIFKGYCGWCDKKRRVLAKEEFWRTKWD
jgi:hypothetical protein